MVFKNLEARPQLIRQLLRSRQSAESDTWADEKAPLYADEKAVDVPLETVRPAEQRVAPRARALSRRMRTMPSRLRTFAFPEVPTTPFGAVMADAMEEMNEEEEMDEKTAMLN